jgi:hypothetical protein
MAVNHTATMSIYHTTGCQVANRVTDVCGGRVIYGNISEISRQRAGCVCTLVDIKRLKSHILCRAAKSLDCVFPI